jgi:hypothetical protein
MTLAVMGGMMGTSVVRLALVVLLSTVLRLAVAMMGCVSVFALIVVALRRAGGSLVAVIGATGLDAHGFPAEADRAVIHRVFAAVLKRRRRDGALSFTVQIGPTMGQALAKFVARPDVAVVESLIARLGLLRRVATGGRAGAGGGITAGIAVAAALRATRRPVVGTDALTIAGEDLAAAAGSRANALAAAIEHLAAGADALTIGVEDLAAGAGGHAAATAQDGAGATDARAAFVLYLAIEAERPAASAAELHAGRAGTGLPGWAGGLGLRLGKASQDSGQGQASEGFEGAAPRYRVPQ